MSDLRNRLHPTCVVCSPAVAHGLQLHCALDAQGAVVAAFDCDAAFEGYQGFLHGGVIAALMDGAMTNCLFLHGHAAVTAELSIRYRHPVLLNLPVRIRAWIARDGPTLFRLEGEMIQDGVRKITAKASFVARKPASAMVTPETQDAWVEQKQ